MSRNKRLKFENCITEELGSIIFNSTPHPIVLINPDLSIKNINPAFEELTEFSKEEIIGRKIPYPWWPEESISAILLEFQKDFNNGVYRREKLFQKKNGENFWVEITSKPILKNGEFYYFLSNWVDITKRKQKEDELKYAYSELEQIFNTAIPMYVMDKNYNIINVNNQFCSLFHLDKDKIINKKCHDVWKGYLCKKPECAMKQLLDGKNCYEYEIDKELVDGTKISCIVKTIPYFNLNGEIIGGIKVFIDISERKNSEHILRESEESLRKLNLEMENKIIERTKELQKSEAKYRALFNGMRSGVAVYEVFGESDEFIFKDINKAGELISNVRKDEILGKNVVDLFPGVISSGLLDTFKEVYKSDKAIRHPQTLYKDKRISHWMENYVYKLPSGEVVSVYDDLTESKIAEGKLKDLNEELEKKVEERTKEIQEQEKFLSDTFSSIQDGICATNNDNEIFRANDAMERMFKEKSPVVGKKCFELFHNRTDKCNKCSCNDLIHKGQPCNIKIKRRDINGKIIGIYDAYCFPLTDQQTGVIKGKIEYIKDNTEKYHTEKLLKKSEKKYRVLFENSPISLWEEDFSEIKTYIDNLRASGVQDLRKFFDNNPEEIYKCVSNLKINDINQKTLEIYKAETKTELISGLDKIFTNESFWIFKEELIWLYNGETRFETECITKTLKGNRIYISLILEIVPGYEKNWSKVLISIIDISKRKKAMDKLIESEEKYRFFIENFYGIAFKGHQDFSASFFNGAIEEITGYQEEDFISSKIRWDQLIHPEDLPTIQKAVEKFHSSPIDVDEREYRIIDKSGKIHWVVENIQKYVDTRTDEEVVQGTVIDITEKKKIENLIIKENKKLNEINQIRKDLITRVSHELNTPLISIYSASELLLNYLDEQMNEKVYDYVKIINEGGQRMKHLVDELLFISRLEAKKLVLKKKQENIVKIIKNCLLELNPYAIKRKIFLISNLTKNLFLEIDKEKFRVIVTNILSNAIKNSPQMGKVTLSLVDNDEFVDLIIKDQGVGLTDEEKHKLFKKFGKIERYGQGMDIDIEGTGLGLYITQELVNLHEGRIFVESKGRNQGATFTIRLNKNRVLYENAY